jgi:hypothetical protein
LKEDETTIGKSLKTGNEEGADVDIPCEETTAAGYGGAVRAVMGPLGRIA